MNVECITATDRVNGEGGLHLHQVGVVDAGVARHPVYHGRHHLTSEYCSEMNQQTAQN